jgi:L,D-transpeptidase catalytic domain
MRNAPCGPIFGLSRFAAVLAGAWLYIHPFPANAEILITIDKAVQQMTVEVDGAKRWVWPVSTGLKSYETPAGDFQPYRMVADHYSKEWDEAPMPHSIFFTEGGHAIHGSFETRRLGRRASHGCVRLSTKNAKKLFKLVRRQGLSNTRVVVLPDPNAPIVAKRNAPATTTSRAATIAPAGAGFSIGPAAQTYGYVPVQPVATPQQQPALPVAPAPQSETIPQRLELRPLQSP